MARVPITREAPAVAPVAPVPRMTPAASSVSRVTAWDLLLICVAVYLATSIGRIHQLFPILSLFKPVLLSTVLATGLFLLQRSGQRRIGLLNSATTTCLLGLVVWGALAIPTALNQGVAFQFWINFVRTVVMTLVIAGSVRHARDLSRLMFVLLGFTMISARARLVGLIGILAVVFASASDRYWKQMQTIFNPQQDYNLTSDAGRLKVWKRGLGYMTDHPIVGVGGDNFGIAEGTISPLARRAERGLGVHWGAAHNTF